MSAAAIHIIDRFDVPWSGSSLSALALRRLLAPHAETRVWSLTPVHPEFREDAAAIDRVDVERGLHPRGGTLVIHGSHVPRMNWLAAAAPRRIVLLCNITLPERFLETLRLLRNGDLPEPDLVFRSERLRRLMALDGVIEVPLIDLQHFRPHPQAQDRRFTVGRHSRDELFKHAEDDPSLYRMIALAGCRVRIMGGTCLEPYLGPDRTGIELLATGDTSPLEFLHTLDCFFFRTGTVEESYGRSVMEAMACGLPTVCHRRGGHAETIVDGENGFLFASQEEAWDKLLRLRDSAPLRERLGQAARATVEALLSAETLDARCQWYLCAV